MNVAEIARILNVPQQTFEQANAEAAKLAAQGAGAVRDRLNDAERNMRNNVDQVGVAVNEAGPNIDNNVREGAKHLEGEGQKIAEKLAQLPPAPHLPPLPPLPRLW